MVKIKDRYFNYDNVGLFDFYVGERGDTKEKVYAVQVYVKGRREVEIIRFDDEETFELAKRNLEKYIINNFVFIDLLSKEE